MKLPGLPVSVNEYGRAKQRERELYVKDKKGNIVGGGFLIPKGDFAHFLGFDKEGRVGERPKQKAFSGAEHLENMLKDQFRELGKGALERGEGYRNLYVAGGRLAKQPGREQDMIKSGMDAMQESVEIGHAMGMRYLEMQYKFQLASESFGTVSNLMKTRSESIKKSIGEVH